MRPGGRLPLGWRVGLLAGCARLLGGDALAQQPSPARPSPVREPVFSVRLFQTFDRESGSVISPPFDAGQANFARTAIRAEVARTFKRPRFSVDLAGAAQVGHDPARGDWLIEERSLAGRVQGRLSRRLSVTLSERVGHSQAYAPLSANTTQGEASNPLIDAADLSVRGLGSFTASSSASLSMAVTRRYRAQAAYDFNRVDARGTVAIGNHRLSGGVTGRLSRNWSFQAGYQSAWGAAAAGRDVTSAYSHQVDLRISCRLPFSRGTTVAGSLAPTFLASRSAARDPFPSTDARSDSFALQGQASVDHGFGPTSRLGFAYQRAASFPPGSTAAILADVVTVRGAGRLHRRVTAQFAVSSSRGRPSAGSRSGWVRADLRMSAAALLYVEYAYDSRAAVRSAFALPALERSHAYRSLRMGVTIVFASSGLAR